MKTFLSSREYRFFFGLFWVALLLLAPSVFTRTSRDAPTVLNRYSAAYALLIGSYVVALVGFLWLGLRQGKVSIWLGKLFESILNFTWRHRRLARLAAGASLILVALTIGGVPRVLAVSGFDYPSLILVSVALAVTAWLGMLLWHDLQGAWEDYSFLTTRAAIVLAFVLSIIVSFYFWGGNLQAQWGRADDHEAFEELGPDRSMQPGEYVRALVNSENAIPFQGTRYKPVDVYFRLTEAFVLRDQIQLWYLGRILLFALFTFTAWLALRRILGPATAFLFILAVFTLEFWGDIYSRLGPAEGFGALTMALYALAIVELLHLYTFPRQSSRLRLRATWLLYLVSGILCLGTKENFVILIVPNIIFLGYLVWKRKATAIAYVCTTVMLLWAVFIISSIVYGVAGEGVDVYRNNTGLADRLQVLMPLVGRALSRQILLAAAGLAVVTLLAWYRLWRNNDHDGTSQLRSLVIKFGFAIFALALLYVSQFAFYNGDWPSNNRYDFPGVLAGPFIFLAVALFLINLVQIVTGSRTASNVSRLAIVVLLIAIIFVFQYSPLLRATANNVRATQKFTQSLDYVASVLRRSSSTALIIESHSHQDVEGAHSIAVYLWASSITNPIYLDFHKPAIIASDDPMAVAMTAYMENESRGTPYSKYYMPITKFKGGDCYSVTISGDMHLCPVLLRLW